MKTGSLFTGYGGLDSAARTVFGGELAWVSDNHPSAVKLLAHRYPTVPNLGDITAIDWGQVEPVDLLTAGFPCQDISNAGRRAGIEGARSGLWSYVADAVRVLRPRHVVLENVSALLVRGLDRVVADLAALGYDLRWTCIRASDVGAPHRRERWFGYATPADADAGRLGAVECHVHAGKSDVDRRASSHSESDRRHEGRTESAGVLRGPDAPVSGGEPATHSHGDGVREQPVAQSRCGGTAVAVQSGSNGASTHAAYDGCEELHDGTIGDGSRGSNFRDPAGGAGLPPVRWGPFEPAIRRWESALGRVAPAPTQLSRNDRPVLSPRFVEWMQGVDGGWVTDVPDLSRTEMLRLLGNGVVPQQGEAALRWLVNAEALRGAA